MAPLSSLLLSVTIAVSMLRAQGMEPSDADFEDGFSWIDELFEEEGQGDSFLEDAAAIRETIRASTSDDDDDGRRRHRHHGHHPHGHNPHRHIPCSTGSGTNCKTCVPTGSRTQNNQCQDCNPGYAYSSWTCQAVQCPPKSTGDSVGTNCVCNAGYQGEIIPISSEPHYNGSCDALPCPVNSIGPDLPGGCECTAEPGNLPIGSIRPELAPKYMSGSCEVIESNMKCILVSSSALGNKDVGCVMAQGEYHETLVNKDLVSATNQLDCESDIAQAFDASLEGPENAWFCGSGGCTGTYVFPKIRTIGMVSLWNAPEYGPTGRVDIKYWSGSSWAAVKSPSSTEFPSPTEREKLDVRFEPVETQKLRFQLHPHDSSPDKSKVGLAEIQIFQGHCSHEMTPMTCEAKALHKCQGNVPCIDLRQNHDHYIMWLKPDGNAHVDGEANNFDDERTWSCTCEGRCQGLVGNWRCPSLFDGAIAINSYYANDFTAAADDEFISVCALPPDALALYSFVIRQFDSDSLDIKEISLFDNSGAVAARLGKDAAEFHTECSYGTGSSRTLATSSAGYTEYVDANVEGCGYNWMSKEENGTFRVFYRAALRSPPGYFEDADGARNGAYFFQRLPFAASNATLLRVSVERGVCESKTTIEFPIGSDELLNYLRDGVQGSWISIDSSSVKVLEGSLGSMCDGKIDRFFAGDGDKKGWILACDAGCRQGRGFASGYTETDCGFACNGKGDFSNFAGTIVTLSYGEASGSPQDDLPAALIEGPGGNAIPPAEEEKGVDEGPGSNATPPAEEEKGVDVGGYSRIHDGDESNQDSVLCELDGVSIGTQVLRIKAAEDVKFIRVCAAWDAWAVFDILKNGAPAVDEIDELPGASEENIMRCWVYTLEREYGQQPPGEVKWFDDGRWSLALNLATSDGNVSSYENTEFWESATSARGINTENSSALKYDYKHVDTFGSLEAEELLLMLHRGGEPIAWRSFDMQSKGETLASYFQAGSGGIFPNIREEARPAFESNRQFTARVRQSGGRISEVDPEDPVWKDAQNLFVNARVGSIGSDEARLLRKPHAEWLASSTDAGGGLGFSGKYGQEDGPKADAYWNGSIGTDCNTRADHLMNFEPSGRCEKSAYQMDYAIYVRHKKVRDMFPRCRGVELAGSGRMENAFSCLEINDQALCDRTWRRQAGAPVHWQCQTVEDQCLPGALCIE